MKYNRVPSELISGPFFNRALTINGLSVVESCAHIIRTQGAMLLEEHLLLYVRSGQNVITHGKATYVVKQHEMLLMKKNTLMQYDKTGQYDSVLFFLKDEFLLDFIRIANIKDTTTKESAAISPKPVTERMQKFIESVVPYFSEPENVDEGLLRIKMLELLYDVAATDKNLLQQLLQMKHPVKSELTAIVEENFTNPITIEQLAYLSGRSLASFKRDFNTIYNIPPSDWIRIKRLNKAKEALENTDLSVLDICYMVGFENPSHFSRIFKEHFGYPPSAVRQPGINEPDSNKN
ncbi:AraC family transcriptional regulator [Niastella yeongjuensis]|uniref:AraC family transcriptional regulator n=1 Tax=Niastella yeongjuensis TaxID=354355 RepID=A0A1V9EJI6_9BACT|nr:AraC family transcriptional regulator [Niastella yeongjuensis]OQP46293.1 AraC family transcriptional regulator [Niastella yeongjuensis]